MHQGTYVFVLGRVRALLVDQGWVRLDNSVGHKVVQLHMSILISKFATTCPASDGYNSVEDSTYP